MCRANSKVNGSEHVSESVVSLQAIFVRMKLYSATIERCFVT